LFDVRRFTEAAKLRRLRCLIISKKNAILTCSIFFFKNR